MLKNFKNLAVLSVVVAAVIIGGALVYTNQNKCADDGSLAGALSAQAAAEKALTFINKEMLQEGATASLVDVTEASGVYKLKLKIQDQDYESYISKDANIFFIYGVNTGEQTAQQDTTGEPEKTDVPTVRLFVMAHCPYGLQAQKALLPVMDLLKDKADIGVYFVNYIMHGKNEIDENLRQYCIQKEQNDKYGAYLNCFALGAGVEGFDKCLSDAGIDKNKMNSCISATDQQFKITEQYNDKSTWVSGQFPKFSVHDDLNQQYGVQGSPTLIINGKLVNANRSPEEFKKAVCDAFITAPAECNQTLSTEAASSGFGGGTGTSGGSCQ